MQEVVYHSNYKLEDSYFWFQGRAEIIEKIMDRKTNLEKGDEILDIGCGTGGFAQRISHKYNVACLDIEPIALEYCKKRGLNDINQGYLNDFDSSGRNIKAAIMLDVLEHIEDDSKVAAQVYDLLLDDGYFIVTVPAYQWMWSHHDDIHMHFRRHTMSSISNLIKNAGFNIKYKSYFNTFLFPLAVVNRSLSMFLGESEEDPVVKLPGGVNWLFEKIFKAEKLFLPTLRFPYGLSIVVIAQK